MPANLPAKWYVLNEKIKEARDLKEKVELLKKLISITPRHKGTENLLADLRKRLSRLKKELKRKKEIKRGRKKIIFKKVGDIVVSIVGLTNSGKSLLLKKLTNADVEISKKPFSTTTPKTGVCFFEGVRIQFVEIPSFFLPEHLSIVYNSDIILILLRNDEELGKIKDALGKLFEEKEKIILLNSTSSQKKFLTLDILSSTDFSFLLKKIIEKSDIIRIFTKPPGKEVEKKAIILKKGAKVKDAIKRINEKFLENFKFAKIYDGSKFSPRRVGLEYELKDGDILEVHTK